MTGFLPSKTIQMQHLEVPNKKKPSPQPSLPIDINKTIGLFLNIGVVMAGDILFTIFLMVVTGSFGCLLYFQEMGL